MSFPGRIIINVNAHRVCVSGKLYNDIYIYIYISLYYTMIILPSIAIEFSSILTRFLSTSGIA